MPGGRTPSFKLLTTGYNLHIGLARKASNRKVIDERRPGGGKKSPT